MKRGQPLQRRTPLKAKKALSPGSPLKRGAGIHPGPWPSKSKPIRVKREGARRRNRDDTGHGMAWADVRLIIYTRAGGRCEVCGKALNIASMEGHHRRTRKIGPDCPCNALALCGSCHHGPTVHGGPKVAMETGRIISRHDDTPPSEIPVRLAVGQMLLSCGGTYLPSG